MLTFVPLQEAFVRSLRGPQPGGFRAAGLEVQAAGWRACERTGLYCYKFHHLFQMREMDGRVFRVAGRGRDAEEEEEGGALIVLFQLRGSFILTGLIRGNTRRL